MYGKMIAILWRFFFPYGEVKVVPREVVMEYARAIELKLRQREHRGPWSGYSIEDRMMLLSGEFEELVAEVNTFRVDKCVAAEAVDVGATAMFVWDGAEPGEREDGR